MFNMFLNIISDSWERILAITIRMLSSKSFKFVAYLVTSHILIESRQRDITRSWRSVYNTS